MKNKTVISRDRHELMINVFFKKKVASFNDSGVKLSDMARGVTHVKVYIFVYTYISVCVQYVHIYTVYSAAVPSFVVTLYSASNCSLFYRYCRNSTLNEEK